VIVPIAVVVQPGLIIEPSTGERIGIGNYRSPNTPAAETSPLPKATFGLARPDPQCRRVDRSVIRPVRLFGLPYAGARTLPTPRILVFKDQSTLYPASRRMRTGLPAYSILCGSAPLANRDPRTPRKQAGLCARPCRARRHSTTAMRQICEGGYCPLPSGFGILCRIWLVRSAVTPIPGAIEWASIADRKGIGRAPFRPPKRSFRLSYFTWCHFPASTARDR
jgi:hypothetical protein